MISLQQWIQGVEGIWLIWLVSLAVIFRLSCLALRRWRWPRWGELARGEDGLSYSLPYVLVIPCYLLFVCVVFEATWLLIAKVGTMYAAHAGARSAVVWSTALPESKRNPRIYQSVWTAMTPFVTGDPRWISLPPGVSAIEFGKQSAEYVGAYEAYQAANAPASLITSRFLTAASRTTCEWHPDVPQPGDLTVTVTYRAQPHIPGAARFLANVYKIVSSVTLPNEAPANDKGTLGIDYKSDLDN